MQYCLAETISWAVMTIKAECFANLVLKLVLAAAVYCIWTERNQRIFKNIYVDAVAKQKQISLTYESTCVLYPYCLQMRIMV